MRIRMNKNKVFPAVDRDTPGVLHNKGDEIDFEPQSAKEEKYLELCLLAGVVEKVKSKSSDGKPKPRRGRPPTLKPNLSGPEPVL